MGFSAKEAAEKVGITKAGIMKAIRTGKLSANKDVHGEWNIEPVELFRVYQPKETQVVTVPTNTDNLNQDRTTLLEEKIVLLERMIADKDDTISKLFDRLAAQQQVTLLLEDKQHPRQWWQRILRRG
jgi:hypothetical protein